MKGRVWKRDIWHRSIALTSKSQWNLSEGQVQVVLCRRGRRCPGQRADGMGAQIAQSRATGRHGIRVIEEGWCLL